jgi:ATP/maltotriose-dependent transcriptional regulator MalT
MTTVDELVVGAPDLLTAHEMFRGCTGRAGVSRPGLQRRLEGSARVTVVSAPAGSGKTVLLRSWIGEAGLTERAA